MIVTINGITIWKLDLLFYDLIELKPMRNDHV